MDFDSFRSYLDCQRHRSAILSDPTSWPAGQVKYTKGRLATAVLDAELRDRSGVETDLMDVTRILNEKDRDVNQDDLTGILARVLDADIESWLRRYVTGVEVPKLPEDPVAYGLSEEESDPTGPTSTEDEEDEEEDLMVMIKERR